MSCYLPEIGNVPVLARLSISSGDSWSRPFSLKTGADGTTPIDLTSKVVAATVMKDLDGTELFAPTVVIDADPTTGNFVMTIDADMSAMLTPGVYAGDEDGQYWLLVRVDTTTLLKFVINCLPGIAVA